MKAKRILQIVFLTLAVVLVIGYWIGSLVWVHTQQKDGVCNAVEMQLLDEDQRQYVTKNELAQMLQAKGIYPVGKRINSVLTDSIERTLEHHPMIRTAECYLTTDDNMRILLTQRVPVVKVSTETETYYVDTDHRLMPARAAITTPTLVVSGRVGPRMASEEIADFAIWLQSNKYWRERIKHIDVRSKRDIVLLRQDIHGTLMPVRLGELHDYEKKLDKLRIFMENEVPDQPQYREIDLRYKDQVIGRK